MRKAKSNVRFEMVEISNLKSGTYQRAINIPHVQNIIKNFDKRNFDPIVVSEREDGSLRLVDGQHRITACKALGIKSVMARVVTRLSDEEEAQLFLNLSGTKGQIKNLNRVDVFNAKLVAKDKTAVSVKEIVESNGFKISDAPGSVRAFSSLTRLYEQSGSLNVDRTFKVIKGAWGTDNSMATKNLIIEGVSKFISTYGNDNAYSDEAFTAALARVTPAEIIKMVSNDTTTRVRAVKILNAMLNVYNFNKKKNIINNTHFIMR